MEAKARTQRAKTFISAVKRGGMTNDKIERRLEEIFGKGSRQEIEGATTKEKIAERIEELSKREEQFEEWERMRREAKKSQLDDRRLNLFWRMNKTFPAKFGGEEETPDPQETLDFWRSIKNKKVSEGWKVDRSIREAFSQVRWRDRRSVCRWFKFAEAEFDEVLRCTAPWKACGVDSVNSFPIKRCPQIKKAVFEQVKKMVEWKVTDRWVPHNSAKSQFRDV